jgi:hypothetical protein
MTALRSRSVLGTVVVGMPWWVVVSSAGRLARLDTMLDRPRPKTKL